MSNVLSLVAVSFLLTLLLFSVSRIKFLQEEAKRKSVHITMGFICSLFPLLFDEKWPVYILGVTSFILLILVKQMHFLKNKLGAALHSIERKSYGEFYLIIAVVFLWWLNHDHWSYSISILVLTFSDSAAAIIGQKYGKNKFTTFEGEKSIEGSFIFFITTYFCVHIPLLVFTDINKINCLYIAAIIGIVIMIIEAVAWRGIDNLLIPLATFLLLEHGKFAPIEQLNGSLVTLILLFIYALIFRKNTTLDDSTLAVASLYPYFMTIFSHWTWGIAPIVVFSTYSFISPVKFRLARDRHIFALIAILIGPTAIVVLQRFFPHIEFFVIYHLLFLNHFTCILIARMAYRNSPTELKKTLLKSVVIANILLALPMYFLLSSALILQLTFIQLIISYLCGILFIKYQRQLTSYPTNIGRWVFQTFLATSTALISLIILC